MGLLGRLERARDHRQDLKEAPVGGKPNKGTKADKRLKENKGKKHSSGRTTSGQVMRVGAK